MTQEVGHIFLSTLILKNAENMELFRTGVLEEYMDKAKVINAASEKCILETWIHMWRLH